MIDEIFRARANFYAFLSRMFVEEPPFELVKDMTAEGFFFPHSSSFNNDFAAGLDLLSKSMKSGKDAKSLHEQLCREYTRLFVGPIPAMFPYESKYIDGSMMAGSLLLVKDEYRKAGLKRVAEYHEPEDHIAMELGFMGNLCRDKSCVSSRLQKDFLNRHLSRWIPGFCDELCEKTTSDFYRGIARIMKGFLISEMDILREPAATDR